MPDANEAFPEAQDRHKQICERIAMGGRDPDTVRIIAVTKGHGTAAIDAALRLGLTDIGENYADELVEKSVGLGARTHEVCWHFQGRLQTNKINRLRGIVNMWQTLDSAQRCEALASRVPGATILIQVDSSCGRADRTGVLIEAVPDLVHHATGLGLHVAGLMTIAPLPEHNVGSAREAFERLAQCARDLDLVECSMGMSDDFEDAIKAGSTMIRIGSGLFGTRT
jgi:PLP dependent protein